MIPRIAVHGIPLKSLNTLSNRLIHSSFIRYAHPATKTTIKATKS